MARTKTYRLVFEHDGAMWHVHTPDVPDVESCQSQGKTLAQARERIRQALGLFDSSAHRANFIEDVRLPRTTLASLKKLNETRKARDTMAQALEAMNHALEARQAKLALELTGTVGVNAQDVAELLELPKSRVQQLFKRG